MEVNKQAVAVEQLSHFKAKQDLQNLEKFKLKNDSTDLAGAVRYDAAQVLTEEQKAQARANIGAGTVDGSGGTVEGAVLYNAEQDLDEDDKARARANIGTTDGTWENMPDKPFSDERVVIELPSDVSNCTKISSQPLSALDGLSFSFVKVLDVYFNSPEETYGAKVKWTNDGNTSEFVIDASYVNDLENGFSIIDTSVGFAPLFMNVTSAGTSTIPSASLFGEDMVFNVSETGVYFLYVEEMAATESYENGEIKQIEKNISPMI